MKIIVVDDEKPWRISTREFLQDLGWEVLLASDGSEGIDLLRSHADADLVLVDLRMPVMDGFSFIQSAAALQPDLPIVAVSGIGVLDEAVRAIRLGAWDFIAKPVTNLDVFAHTLERNLERARLVKENRRHQQKLTELVNIRTEQLEAALAESRRKEAAMKAAKEDALAANRAKSEFLANISHEIRTPTNAILGLTGLALTHDIPGQTREYLGYVREAGNSLMSIIQEILDISKVEAGRLDLDSQDFNIRSLLGQTVRMMLLQASRKGLALGLDIAADLPDMVRGDGCRIKQMLTNLIGNAVKFTEKGGISVRAKKALPAKAQDERSVWVLLEVEDTGIGIPPDKLEEIFEPFKQVDSTTTRKFGGTGLGLAIARQLASLMGGSIQARSELGSGSLFSCVMRLERARGTGQDRVVRPARETEVDQRGLSILLAEDDAKNQLLAKSYFENEGHMVKAVNNGREALDALAADRFDVVFMDVSMPSMDGVEATRRIRAGEAPGKRDIPIVALTAHSIKGDKEAFLAAGMNHYLSKPLDFCKLKKLLNVLQGDAGPC